MENDQFWSLIETSEGLSSDDSEQLINKLAALPADLIVDFYRIFRELFAAAYQWNLWGAAYLINDGCSDDGFEYFRCWLISKGQAIFHAALENPDTLASHTSSDINECESLLYAADEAYEKKTGQEMPLIERSTPDEPAGEEWNFDDPQEMQKHLPALFNRLGNS